MTAISVLSMLLRLQPVDKVHYVILQPLLVVIHIDPLDRRPQPPPSFSDNGPPNARYNLKHATEPASINNSLFCFIPKKKNLCLKKTKKREMSNWHLEIAPKLPLTKHRWAETINKFTSDIYCLLSWRSTSVVYNRDGQFARETFYL